MTLGIVRHLLKDERPASRPAARRIDHENIDELIELGRQAKEHDEMARHKRCGKRTPPRGKNGRFKRRK